MAITQSAQHPVIKLIKVLLVIFIIFAAVAVYLFLNPSVWQSWVKDTPLEAPASITKLYKWQDAGGEWQITDTPPKQGIDYELLEYRSDSNVMPLAPREDN